MSAIAASTRVREAMGAVRDELTALLAMGPIVTRREAEGALRLLRLTGATIEGSIPDLGDPPPANDLDERRAP